MESDGFIEEAWLGFVVFRFRVWSLGLWGLAFRAQSLGVGFTVARI